MPEAVAAIVARLAAARNFLLDKLFIMYFYMVQLAAKIQ